MSWHYIKVLQTEVELSNSIIIIALRTPALSLVSMSNPFLPTLRLASDWRFDQSSLCHPCVHAQALNWWAFPVLRASRRPAQPQRRVEVWPVVLTITTVVWATRWAEAVGRWTSQNILSAGPLLWLLWGEARRGDTLPWWRNGLRLDVYALAGADW